MLKSFAYDTADDLGGFVTAPLRFDGSDWAWFAGITGSIALAGVFLDDTHRNDTQEDRTVRGNQFAKIANQGGTIYSLGVLGAFGAASWFDDEPPQPARRVLRDGLEATIIASGVIVPVLKYAAGRERPNKDEDGNDDWTPFSGNYSFPSGHTTQAFAVASVIAANYRDRWWVAPLSYGLASTVGWARMNDNQHFLSDVLAGAAIGTAVGWYVADRNDERHGKSVAMFMPLVGHDLFGVEAAFRF